MADYNDKNLVRILVEGTKAVYGPEKADRVKAEIGATERLNYRRNAEDLTIVVNRVLSEPKIESGAVNSIDETVKDYQKPNMLTVALKGTAGLINKTRWYYPLAGALPGKYQKKIAKRLGDNPNHYTVSNALFEGLAGFAGIAAAMYSYKVGVPQPPSYVTALLIGNIINFPQFFMRATSFFGVEKKAIGSLLTTIPFYITLYSFLAVKAAKQSYSSAYQKEQQKLLEAKLARIDESKARIEQPEIVEEEFDDTETGDRHLGKKAAVNCDFVNKDLNRKNKL